jgi:hypothetical protein
MGDKSEATSTKKDNKTRNFLIIFFAFGAPNPLLPCFSLNAQPCFWDVIACSQV